MSMSHDTLMGPASSHLGRGWKCSVLESGRQLPMHRKMGKQLHLQWEVASIVWKHTQMQCGFLGQGSLPTCSRVWHASQRKLRKRKQTRGEKKSISKTQSEGVRLWFVLEEDLGDLGSWTASLYEWEGSLFRLQAGCPEEAKTKHFCPRVPHPISCLPLLANLIVVFRRAFGKWGLQKPPPSIFSVVTNREISAYSLFLSNGLSVVPSLLHSLWTSFMCIATVARTSLPQPTQMSEKQGGLSAKAHPGGACYCLSLQYVGNFTAPSVSVQLLNGAYTSVMLA